MRNGDSVGTTRKAPARGRRRGKAETRSLFSLVDPFGRFGRFFKTVVLGWVPPSRCDASEFWGVGGGEPQDGGGWWAILVGFPVSFQERVCSNGRVFLGVRGRVPLALGVLGPPIRMTEWDIAIKWHSQKFSDCQIFPGWLFCSFGFYPWQRFRLLLRLTLTPNCSGSRLDLLWLFLGPTQCVRTTHLCTVRGYHFYTRE